MRASADTIREENNALFRRQVKPSRLLACHKAILAHGKIARRPPHHVSRGKRVFSMVLRVGRIRRSPANQDTENIAIRRCDLCYMPQETSRPTVSDPLISTVWYALFKKCP
ncbi:hypothetical protein CPU03_10395 [Edwardsiella tarda]|nr:hypothetical protein CPU03_10395 [Edwardsiella tarda]